MGHPDSHHKNRSVIQPFIERSAQLLGRHGRDSSLHWLAFRTSHLFGTGADYTSLLVAVTTSASTVFSSGFTTLPLESGFELFQPSAASLSASMGWL